ncbi:UvrD-helicase domain-containing protein [Paenibacillus chitinolyticus]|uniref:UvrD-helicase domain-containing protein n=1 Tax=Paenibacillus chitinolyticus TaxID=79263 RepID=UPI00365CC714
MSQAPFYTVPPGTGHTNIPQAVMASAHTSRELVPDGDRDAFYFRRLEEQGIALNEPQIRAVRHFEGPLLTLAGAGSGKTSVLVCRTGYLLAVRGIRAASILLVTFSSKAAAEMRERIAALPGITAQEASRLQARTFHSFFLRVIRSQGVQEEIFNETRRQHILLKQIMRELGIPDTYQPETLLTLLSSYKMNRTELQDLPQQTKEEKEIRSILIRYEEWKRANAKIDFDDVLLRAYRMLKENESLLRSLQNRFQYVMVDEFQDTNGIQYELIRMIASPQNHLMVVGDDDQTIYSFNGARSEFILHFEKEFPSAKVITLAINYRSGASIVGLGNEIIRHNKMRRVKTLEAANAGSSRPQYIRPLTTDEEAEIVLIRIRQDVERGKRSYGDYAVLYRSASNNRALLEQLVLREIPYIDYGDGQLLYEHWLIKPVLDHMRLSLNRRDFEAMEGVLPSLYINREHGMAYIRQQEARQPKKGPLVHLLSMPDKKDFQIEKIQARLELIRELKKLKPIDAIRKMRVHFYDAYVETDGRKQPTQHKEMLKEMLDELETSAERFRTTAEFVLFVDDVLSRSRQSGRHLSEEQGNRVALMTIHRSKGLEFPVVVLIGACEGSLPHSSVLDPKAADGAADLEEERRLAYVAVTRAREELIVSSPSLYRGRKAGVSRFVVSAFTGRSGDTPASGRRAQPSSGKRTVTAVSRTAAASVRAPERSAPAAPVRTETVPAWLCTGTGCNAWVRIAAGEPAAGKASGAPAKACPLCGAPMTAGRREAAVRTAGR